MKIEAAEVEKTLKDCLFLDDGKPPDDTVMVDGIMHKRGFHRGRLESHREQITAWLSALPSEFKLSGGGGWSFLNACMTDADEHWGEHRDMDRLFSLGIGLNLVKCVLPRDMWKSLPGGMPYYLVEL